MEDKLSLSIAQFKQAWQIVCTATPNHVKASLPGMELLLSRLPIPFFNMAFLMESVESATALRKLGTDACAFAADYGVPWFLVVTHEALSQGIDAAVILKECGLAPLVNTTGMFAGDVASLAQAPDGLDLIVPGDDDSSAAIMTVNGAAYGMDIQPAIEDLGSHKFWKNHFAVVGKNSAKPVTCSTVMMVDGYRYVAFVATLPDHQRNGYAEAAMRRSLDLAAEAAGRRPTVLHATDAGRPVYERMGYVPISTHTLFMQEKFLSGH
jgi:GNAT superfamily N-acetyltransferase